MSGLSKMRQIRDLCLTLGTQMCIEDTRGSDITTGGALANELAIWLTRHATGRGKIIARYRS